ncbi:MAG: hypothetical protein LDL07_03460 [Desulfarculus sp.]|nr:hypothetical protein [Desulfarculus sp.]
MQTILEQFKALGDEEKLAFMKQAMPIMAELFGKEPGRMMADMMPFCMPMMRPGGMAPDQMRVMMKSMMG